MVVLFYAIQVFDNFIVAQKFIAKALRSFEASVLVNNNLYWKLFSSLESLTPFDGNFKVTSVPFLFLILIYQAVN